MARPATAPPGMPPDAIEAAKEAIAWCFGCGPDNPHGLHLEPKQEGDATVLEFLGRRELAGWDTVYHGGIVATLIDEVAAFGLFAGPRRDFAMTRRMAVEYKRRVHWTRPLRAEARPLHRDAEKAVFACRIVQDGQVCTEAEVEFRLMKGPPPRGA